MAKSKTKSKEAQPEKDADQEEVKVLPVVKEPVTDLSVVPLETAGEAAGEVVPSKIDEALWNLENAAQLLDSHHKEQPSLAGDHYYKEVRKLKDAIAKELH